MNIYIIDDHALFRNGLIALLESKDILASAASSPTQGLEEIGVNIAPSGCYEMIAYLRMMLRWNA